MEVGHYKKIKIGVIIQARMGSSRLPGKVLLHLPINSDRTILDQILRRIPEGIDTIIATSVNSKDDKIAKVYKNVFRGSENDVLSRFYNCAKQFGFNHIIRLTGDNPIIDTQILKGVINKHIESEMDYSETIGLPLGTNFEIIGFSALKEAYYSAKLKYEREHVTSFVRENKLSNFKTQVIKFNHNPNLRLTVDYPSDYAFINLLFGKLGDEFDIEDVERFIKQNPWAAEINQDKIQLS